MRQINSTKLPAYMSEARLGGTDSKAISQPGGYNGPQINAPRDDSQLTKLSSVLNSLKKGASAMRSQLFHVMNAVQTGTYEIDPLQVSKSIVGESLASR